MSNPEWDFLFVKSVARGLFHNSQVSVSHCVSNPAFGQQLGLAEQTVANNLFQIYGKLGISNRVELVLYARSRQG